MVSSDEVLWDTVRDSARLSAVLRRSGYSAEQFARLMDEVAAAEAAQADRLGLPGIDKIRGGVRRQTVERWAQGSSTPKGWSARLALIVIERLEGTLSSGFESTGEPSRSSLARFGARVRASWVAYLLALSTVVGLLVAFGSTLGFGGSGALEATDSTVTTVESVAFVGRTPAEAPRPVGNDPDAARGSGCDPSPAVAWWSTDVGPPLRDGMWFGRVLQVDGADGPTISMIIDITCFYLIDDEGVVIDPPDQSLDSERAIRVAADESTVVDWLAADGSRVVSGVADWVAGSADEQAEFPVPCPGGRCSVWFTMVDGFVREIVVVEF